MVYFKPWSELCITFFPPSFKDVLMQRRVGSSPLVFAPASNRQSSVVAVICSVFFFLMISVKLVVQTTKTNFIATADRVEQSNHYISSDQKQAHMFWTSMLYLKLVPTLSIPLQDCSVPHLLVLGALLPLSAHSWAACSIPDRISMFSVPKLGCLVFE